MGQRRSLIQTFVIQNFRSDVVVIVTDAGEIVEHTRYAGSGTPFGMPVGDATADGVVDGVDLAILVGDLGESLGAAAYRPNADLNRDGTIDALDLGLVNGAMSTSVAAGEVSTTDTPVGYAGYIFDDVVGMYCVRFRWYEPGIGRWVKRDPLGYVDGMNVYEYVGGKAAVASDPSGLRTGDEHIWEDMGGFPDGVLSPLSPYVRSEEAREFVESMKEVGCVTKCTATDKGLWSDIGSAAINAAIPIGIVGRSRILEASRCRLRWISQRVDLHSISMIQKKFITGYSMRAYSR